MSRMAVPTDFSRPQGQSFLVPADNHLGILIGITDLGTHMESYQGGPEKPVRKIRLQWELPTVKKADGSTATISKQFNYSLSDKAHFRKLLDTWLGKDWTEKHKGESWEFLLGIAGMVQVEHIPSTREPGRTMAIVQSVGKVPSWANPPEPTRDTFFLDLDGKHLPAHLSYWDAEKIRESKEYRAGGFKDEAPREAPGQGGNGSGGQAPQQPGPAMGQTSAPADDMEDVPF